MIELYITGYIIVFIILLVVGLSALVNGELNIFDLLFSLLIIPFFSWIIIFIIIIGVAYETYKDS